MSSLLRLTITALLIASATAATAQWAWKDDTGRVVYSDRPPPTSVKPEQIVRQPERLTTNSSNAPGTTNPAAPKTWADRDAEYKKRQAERAAADKKGVEDQAQQAQRRADCERARSYVSTLESGIRVAHTDAKGERVFMDDDQRAAELKRARDIASKTCS